MRHVTRAHRVDLYRLYDRIKLDPMIQIKCVNTTQQVADMLTKKDHSQETHGHNWVSSMSKRSGIGWRDTNSSSLLSNDCENIQECRHGLPRSASTRVQSWRRLQAWRPVSGWFSKNHHNGDWIIKLRATGSGWSIKLHETDCCWKSVKHRWKESSSSTKHWWRKVHQEVRRSCTEFPASERGGARNFQWSIGQYLSKIGKNPTNFQDFQLNVALWSQFSSDYLWASSWLTKDHEDFKRMAMKKSFPRTQDLIQSVQRQVKTLVERKYAYNMQISQDCNTIRWSRVALLGYLGAKLIRMKVYVFSDSTLESRIQIPPTIGKQNWRYGAKTDSSKNWLWQPKMCNSLGTYYQVLSVLTSRTSPEVSQRAKSRILWR